MASFYDWITSWLNFEVENFYACLIALFVELYKNDSRSSLKTLIQALSCVLLYAKLDISSSSKVDNLDQNYHKSDLR